MRCGALEGGGTKMAAAVLEDNRIEERVQFPTRTPDETLPEIASWFRERKIGALGIASFGPVDLDTASPSYGYITSTPKIPWQYCDILGYFRRELAVPCAFDTDVNAAALAEFTLGAAKGKSSCMYVTVGTGVGGGLIINGQPVHGFMHPEIGHIPLIPDPEDPTPDGFCPYHKHCLEGLAAGPNIEKRWGVSAKELAPDHPAWKLEINYMAQLCASAMFSFSPEMIILGGGVMQQKFLIPEIRRKTVELLGGYFPESLIADGLESYIVEPGLDTASGITGAWLLARQAASD